MAKRETAHFLFDAHWLIFKLIIFIVLFPFTLLLVNIVTMMHFMNPLTLNRFVVDNKIGGDAKVSMGKSVAKAEPATVIFRK